MQATGGSIHDDRVPSAFDARVLAVTGGPLAAASIDTIQVNVGLRCNLACRHCHVKSSPKRTETMHWETMQHVLAAAVSAHARILDITGGAPEMHPHLRQFVAGARARGLEVIVRTNLTILLEPGYDDLPGYFREQRVHLVASLPCYLPENVDRQRGRSVHEQSVEALRRLNAEGYGIDPGLELDLVFNPEGPTLPPPPEALEASFRRELWNRFGIRFSRLITITNMPIGRFQRDLDRSGRGGAYQELLQERFNPATIGGLMCRSQVHVGYDGTLHDCDFNHALGIPTAAPHSRHVRDFDAGDLASRRISTGEHCFGCTAGRGSSCGGAITGSEGSE